jgi:hypothetical protein
MDKIKKMNSEMEKYKAVWKPIRETMNLRDRADLDEQVLLDARQDPCSGVWLTRENSEEESRVSDDSGVDSQEVAESIGRLNNTLDVLDELDREATPRPRLRRIPNGAHGACEGGESGDAEVEGENGGIEESAPTGASVPPPEEGITILVDAIAVLADTAEGHAHGEVSEEDDEAWMEEEESPRSRWRRYMQSGQDEVSEPDEWADIHCGPSTPISTPRRQRSRSRETPMCTQSTPMPRAMQKVIAYRRDQRLAGERG